MELDASGNGLGIRSKRYSMLVDDGVVKQLNLELAPCALQVSGGETLLGAAWIAEVDPTASAAEYDVMPGLVPGIHVDGGTHGEQSGTRSASPRVGLASLYPARELRIPCLLQPRHREPPSRAS